ncbi:MAG: hypothetical protein AB1714_04400 [Acidobacteriota bacterium]
MRRIWRNALLIASLCLNVGFLSAFIIHIVWRSHTHSRPDFDPPAQAKDQFDANFSTFRDSMASLNEELGTEKARLVDILASPNPSQEAVQAQQDKITAVNARITKAFAEHLLRQKRLLTPEEQRQFFDFIRSRTRGRDHR